MMELRSRSRSRTPFAAESVEISQMQASHTVVTRSTRQSTLSRGAFEATHAARPVTRRASRLLKSTVITSDYSSEEGDFEARHISDNERNQIISDAKAAANGSTQVSALNLYRKAGCYWEKYPKTDWTYSPHSVDRVEIAPGVVQMPNMSRRSIRTHSSTNTDAYEERSAEKSEIRRDLFGASEASYRVARTTARTETITSKVWVLVCACFASFYHSVNGSVLYVTKKVHNFVSKVMLYDTWLLKKNSVGKRTNLIVALCILPLILFTAWWLLTALGSALAALPRPSPTAPLAPPPAPPRPDVDLDALVEKLLAHQTFAQNRLHTDAQPIADLKSALKAAIEANHRLLSSYRAENARNFALLAHRLTKCCQRRPLLDVEPYVTRAVTDILRKRGTDPPSSGLTEQQVGGMIAHALRVFDADRTGLVDYAMEPMGGEVVTTRCTESYNAGRVLAVWGVPIWYPAESPRVAITPGLNPGECWAFQNFPGFLVVRLAYSVRIEAFSMEHVSRLLVPDGRIDSAPRDFDVYGLEVENDRSPVLLGGFAYDYDGEALQFFAAEPVERSFRLIELRVRSNHGNPNYTCLYRFRVHGKVRGD